MVQAQIRRLHTEVPDPQRPPLPEPPSLRGLHYPVLSLLGLTVRVLGDYAAVWLYGGSVKMDSQEERHPYGSATGILRAL